MNELIYNIPDSEHKLLFAPEVLKTFLTYRQKENECEAGGLLFAEFDLPIIRIIDASNPTKGDKRWRTLFIPSRILQRQLIRQQFKKGYHFIGEWHTHPVINPSPSCLDIKSVKDSFLNSKHELNYFVMVIVGSDEDGLKLWVSLHDESNQYRLIGKTDNSVVNKHD
jgi:integrative and conjugative element protein (TIGR02256 family)